MRDESRNIAEEFARLSAEGRRRFMSKLRARDLSFGELPIVPAVRHGKLPLSHSQSRFWFLWRLDEQSTAYNIASALRFSGDLDEPALRASFLKLSNRHDSLRTVLRAGEDGTVEQVIAPMGQLDYSLIQLDEVDRDARDSRAAEHVRHVANSPFDLTVGPLFRVDWCDCLTRNTYSL